VQAAPAGLAATVSTAVLLSVGAGAGFGLAAAAKTVAMTTLQKSLVAASLALGLGFGVYEVRQAARLQDRLAAIEQSAAQDQLAAERRLAALADHNARLRAENDRLRADTQARADAATAPDPALRAMADWLQRALTLRNHFKTHPTASIPEMRWIAEMDWLETTKDTSLATENDILAAASQLRSRAETIFVNKAFPALQRYREAHDRQFPAEVAQLQPYFDAPVDPAILARWTILPAKDVSDFKGDWVITQKSAVDDVRDSRLAIGIQTIGATGRGFGTRATQPPSGGK
jgi:hypothetical protein